LSAGALFFANRHEPEGRIQARWWGPKAVKDAVALCLGNFNEKGGRTSMTGRLRIDHLSKALLISRQSGVIFMRIPFPGLAELQQYGDGPLILGASASLRLAENVLCDPFLFRWKGLIGFFYETSITTRRLYRLSERGRWPVDSARGFCRAWHLSYPQVFEEDDTLYDSRIV
jgi:hypothetical protein